MQSFNNAGKLKKLGQTGGKFGRNDCYVTPGQYIIKVREPLETVSIVTSYSYKISSFVMEMLPFPKVFNL